MLMTSFDRNTADFTGLIINKTFTGSDRTLYIGGPCEMGVKTILHNVPNVPGAKPVIEGVWVGGNVSYSFRFLMKEFFYKKNKLKKKCKKLTVIRK